MAAGKHIEAICVIATVCTLLLTVLFMNGEALGLTVLTGGDSGDGPFSDNDLRSGWAEDAGDATRILLKGDHAEIHGNGAYFYDGSVHIVYAGEYLVSGELTGGSLIVDADRDDKIWILLDGVSVRCGDGAGILVEQAEKVFLTLKDGTDSMVAAWEDGGSGGQAEEPAGSGAVDGAIYARDDLTVNGGGSLTVSSGSRHGIVCNDDLVITGGRIAVNAAQDGLHANDSVRIAGAALTIEAGDDGVTVSNDEDTGYFYMESGSVTVPSCYEGIEAANVTVAGGRIDITSTDDGINANSYASSSITISGGDIRIVNPTGRDADGLDSNGDIHVTGGRLFVSVNGNGANSALDCGTESGGVCLLSGGTVIAAGGSAMAEGFDSSSEQGFIMQTVSQAGDGTAVALKNEAGDTLLSETVPCAFSSIILSTPKLQMGETCTLTVGGSEITVTVDNSSPAGAGPGGRFGRGGFGGSGFGGDGRFGGMRDGTDGGMRGEAGNGTDGGIRGGTGDEMRGDAAPAPDGSAGSVETPASPGGPVSQAADGESPRMPGGPVPQAADGEIPRMPGGPVPQAADGGTAAASGGAAGGAILLSAAVLLAGLFIALKTRH